MSDLKSRLVYSTNRLSSTLTRLSRTERPIGLIGCGKYAEMLCGELPRFGISPEFIVLDDRFVKGERGLFCGLPVISPKECAERYPGAVVLIAYNYRYEDEWRIIRNETSKFTPDTEVIALGALFLNELDWIPYEYIIGRCAEFEKTYEMLEDSLSRRIMAEFLNAKISGDASRLLMFNTDSSNDYELELMFGEKREGAVIECGAFDGKSALQIDSFLNGSRRIYALEPFGETYDTLCRNTAGHASVIPVKKGAADREYMASMQGAGGTASIASDGGESVEITTIDRLAGDERVSAIVMDIEGSEYAALKGAEKTILRDRPVLAVRVYHRADDLVTIPAYISSLSVNKGYKYYLRVNNFNIGAYDVTFYAV